VTADLPTLRTAALGRDRVLDLVLNQGVLDRDQQVLGFSQPQPQGVGVE